MIPLLETLTHKFVGHYYPAMRKYHVDRPNREFKNLLLAISQAYNNGGVEALKKAIIKNYKRHLGEDIGEREAQDFILSVKDLMAELALTEDA